MGFPMRAMIFLLVIFASTVGVGRSFGQTSDESCPAGTSLLRRSTDGIPYCESLRPPHFHLHPLHGEQCAPGELLTQILTCKCEGGETPGPNCEPCGFVKKEPWCESP
jgi:hypothetical protein